MSDDLPNQNSSNPWESTPPQIPPSPPANNNVDPVQSWVAQHQKRDENGHFVKSDHLVNDQTPQNNSSQSNGLHLPIQITQNNKYSEKDDPPLVAISVTNPVTYLKLFIKRLLKNEGIDIRLKIKPLTVIAIVTGLSLSFGTGFNVARMFFPNSSPILHRSITLQGNIQRSDSGQYYLSLPDNTLWTLRVTNTNINLSSVLSKQVLVKGNMTAENNVIEVKEVLAFEKPNLQPVYYPQATNSAQPLENLKSIPVVIP